jgi:hypothetical protein
MGSNNRLLAAAVTLAFVCVVAAKVEFVSNHQLLLERLTLTISLISRYSKVIRTAIIMQRDLL